MRPDVHLSLTHDRYDRFEEVLATHNITVRDASRSITEDLPSEALSIHSTAGTLRFRGRDYHYRRQKDYAGGHIEVGITNTDPDALEALLDALERAFPQPAFPPSLPIDLRPWYRQTPCVVALVVLTALCFFIILGIAALIRWL